MTAMLKDRDLVAPGRAKIEFAGKRMPVLQLIREDFERRRPLDGVRIAGCLHVTTETANLCRTLTAGGAKVALCASNPLSTKDDVAAAIHVDYGANVYAIYGADRETFYRQVAGALSHAPDIVVDDGADLTATIHQKRTELLGTVIGGTEVTSTGVYRIRNMARDGVLRYPVVPLNDALTKHLFDNRYGTGQNTIDGILRAAHVLLAGSVLVVAGYGWCGRGVAMRASGMGARVVVVEVDPVVLLAEGRLVGQSAAEAHPAEVMDMSFSTQALLVEHLVTEGRELKPGVHPVPRAIDDRVAREKLHSLGVQPEELTSSQRTYRSSWEIGT
jgi:adenosylhomocysteinase